MKKGSPMWPELSHLRACVYDIETDGLLDTATKTHCLSITDYHTDKTWGSNDVEAMIKKLMTYDVIIGHNIIPFDNEVLYRQFNAVFSDKIVIDTLVLSQMNNYNRRSHSLASYGKGGASGKMDYCPAMDPAQPDGVYNEAYVRKLKDYTHNNDLKRKNKWRKQKGQPLLKVRNIAKPDPAWKGSQWSQLMQDYCDQDTRANAAMARALIGTMVKGFSWQSVDVEMKTRDIVTWQNRVGVGLDLEACRELQTTVEQKLFDIKSQVLEVFPPIPKFDRLVVPKIKKNGEVSSVGLKFLGDDWASMVTPNTGPISRIKWQEFNPGSRPQIVERLKKLGAQFVIKTENGNDSAGTESLQLIASMGIKEAAVLDDYLTTDRVRSFLASWLSKAVWHKDQGMWRIHGQVNTLGAATTRMTHSDPNLAQVPSPKKYLGKECRQLFVPKPGYVIVGCDASGLELRCLAHYVNDPVYTDVVLDGDIHTYNQEAAGLPTRDAAKTFIYAFIYGAGDKLIGALVGGGSAEGKAIKEQFLDANPGLKSLQDRLLKLVMNPKKIKKSKDGKTSYSWIKGLDGRKITVQWETNTKPYTVLNRLLQSMGAIVMKYWLVEVVRRAKEADIDFAPVLNVHDEGQFEVLREHADQFAKICEDVFPWVAEKFELNCPLAGEAAIGESWYETH